MNRIEGCFHAGMKCQRKVLAKWQRQSKKEAGLRGRIPKFQQVGFVPWDKSRIVELRAAPASESGAL